MLSRGALGLASPRVRRGLALSWTALFILSLLLQYASFALAPAALAVHDEQFQLDGNAVDDAGSPPDDWATLVGGGGSADAFTGIIHEPADSTIFTTGGSKDDLDTSSWRWTNGSVPDKDDLLDGFAAIYGDIMYFGADRFANNGDSAVGFWFFQNGLSVNGNGTFSPKHTLGDLFVVSHFENGGAASEIQLYTWVGSGGSDGALDLTATGQICTGAPANDKACGIANQDDTAAPWSYTPKSGTAGTFPQFSLFEGGLDLSQVFEGAVPCFSSFLVETRSSQEVNAQLKDFIAGDFNTCVPPTIATQVRQDGQSLGSVGTINLGDTVTDHATFSGSDGAVTGTAAFHVCFNASSTPNCASGGTAVGSDTISGGTADSDEFTPTAVGFYCFRVNYTPDDASQYLDGSHTNQTTECFQVLPANVTISKAADDGTVSAGDQIGFTLSWGNTGDGKATGVVVTDTLPTDPGLSWSIAGSTGTGSTCAIAAGVLTCNVGSINGNTAVSGTVHIVSGTTAASCGTVDNTGHIASGNDGSGNASDSVAVLCADIDIEKTANPAGPVNSGDPIGFDITVTNTGDGEAKGVHVNDPLPAGVDWTLGAVTGDTTGVTCSITGAVNSEVLTCDDASMASDDSFTVRVTAVMNDTCATIDNTASVTTTNDGSDEASASVGCSVLTIAKSITTTLPTDPDLGVPVAEIGDTVTYRLDYTGGGVLTDASIVDVLPVGLEYKAGTASSNADFAFTGATFDASTKQWTLRWDATGVLPDPVDGFVTYDVTVLAAAADEAQPLTNTATIDSNETPPDSDTQSIAVLPPPEALTPPPTDVFTPATGTSNPGFTLMLILIGIAAATLGIGFITPVPARARRQDRQR
jgi:uncharacterized repeat protein (TIGR01451 family)/fimbrial isopeptide formation D2 family protein